MESIILDEGYLFGIGVFETIAVEKGRAIFLDSHIKRLKKSLIKLGISNLDINKKINEEFIIEYLKREEVCKGVLKIIVSAKNIIFSIRENIYSKEDYIYGFNVDISETIRNETSPLTYIKTLNYGDNILEKRKAKKRGIDEPLFINSKGQLTEGATSNIFFIKEDEIYTPKLSCGMLPGIIREYIIKQYQVVEKIIYPNEVYDYDEMFLTNSILGIMPIAEFNNHKFLCNVRTRKLMEDYHKFINI